MRWLLALWLAIAPACAQEAVIGSGVWGGAKTAGYTTGPGDVVSGAALDISVRAYTAAIAAAGTQKLLNLRNTATNEACDVIVTTNGGFGNVANCSGASSGDTVAVFCAESGGSCASPKGYDQSGNSHDASEATAASQPTLTQAGSPLGGPTLTYSSQDLTTAWAAPFDTGPFSIIAWVNWTSGDSTIVGGSFNSGITFRVSSGSLLLDKQGVNNICTSSSTITASTWTQVAVTFTSGNVCTFYINGSSAGTATHAGSSLHPNVILGNNSGGEAFKGGIAEVLIYTSALSSTQISNLYSQPSVP